jgi:hypothetical protein
MLSGLQRMKSNAPEVRALLQAIASKISAMNIQLDSKAIGSALYGQSQQRNSAKDKR